MAFDIVFVTETFSPEVNGVAMTLGRLLDGMRQRGHRVRVVRPRQGRADAGSEFELALPGLPLPGYPGLRFGWPAGRTLLHQWRLQRPDLVHVVTEGPLGWSAVAVARRLGIPVTSSFHTNFERYSVHYGLGWMRPAVAAYLRLLHRRTRLTMVPTGALAAELAGAGIEGVRVVGRGVDTGLFDPARRSDTLRAAWGVPEGGLACLYVGRMAAEKNLALLGKAFAAIQRERPDARLVWVGDGPAASSLRQAHPEHHFAGVRLGDELAAHYASADLFLFPSLSETYGNVVAEAMASGVPVLAYRSAGAAELIHDGLNGRQVPAGDEALYIDAARDLARAAPGQLRALAEAARLSMLPRHWAQVVERFETVLCEALDRPAFRP